MGHRASSRTLYEVLGVSESVSGDDVRRLRRELARRYHPDVSPTPDPDKLVRILEACDILGDPERRRRYDASLALHRAELRETTPTLYRPWTSPARFPWSTMWLQVVVYGLAAATVPGYVTAYWIGSDLSPASAQSSPHLLLFDPPVLITLALQALLAVSVVIAVHALRHHRAAQRSGFVRRSLA